MRQLNAGEADRCLTHVKGREITSPQGGSKAADAKAAPRRAATNRGAILSAPKRFSSRKVTAIQGTRLPASCRKLACRNAASQTQH